MIPKTLVISDLHLTTTPDPKKFRFLKKLISSFDRVIINGDLWCVYTDTFDQFINSDWQRLFPLLKSKKTIYLNGNHDEAKYTDNRIYQFCDQQLAQYTLSDPPFTFHIEHGPRLTQQKYPLSQRKLDLYHRYKVQKIINFSQQLVLNLAGYFPIRIISKKHNNLLRNFSKKLPKNQYLVCGHTHLPEYDQKNKFINTGFIDGGYASYLAIWGDSFELITTKY